MSMKLEHKERIAYVAIIVFALCATFLISPVWGGPVLFWLGLIVAVFFVFATIGSLRR